MKKKSEPSIVELSIAERKTIRSTLHGIVEEIGNRYDRPDFVFKEHDLENVMDVLDPDGVWRLRVRQFRHKKTGRVVLYFGGWEFEGLGNDKYTFENGILRDSDGDEIKIRNVEKSQKLKTRKDVNLANALSLVNRVFIESGIQWRVYKADLNFDDGSVPVCYYCDTSKFPDGTYMVFASCQILYISHIAQITKKNITYRITIQLLEHRHRSC